MSEDTFFRKWLEGKADDEEILQEGKSIFPNPEEFDQYKRIIDAAGSFELPAENNKEEAWNKLESRLESKEDTNPVNATPKVVSIKRYSVQKVAAVAALFIVTLSLVYLLNKNEEIVHITGNSEQKTIILPDNSSVILNAGSSISFSPSNWNENRIVSLKGEAFFDVKKGTKFEVISEVGKVDVLGTSFNVKARDNQYEVACFTGRVEVFYKESQASKVLTKGLATKIDNRRLSEPFGFVESKVSGWQSGLFYFEATPLMKVFEEIERQFDVALVVEASLENRLYSGHFTTEELNKALEIICLPMNLQFKIEEGNKIIIKEFNE